MNEEKKPARKKIHSTTEMNRIMAEYFYELDNAAKTGEKKIAWCTSVGPAEILRAMGFLVYFPENHAAMLGATRMSTDVIPLANARGYSPDICSYLTADIGAYIAGVTPLSKAYKGIEKVPKPDVLVYNTNQCRDVQDWFMWYAQMFKVPLIGINTHLGIRDVNDAHVASIVKQMEDLIKPLSAVSGKKFDLDELKQVVALSRACSDSWKKVLDTAAAVPSPITFFDGTIHMGPAVVLRGTKQAVDYYNLLLAELNERIRNKESALENERFRLYWDGMPVWGRLSDHAALFANLNTNVLASTYCNSWIFTDFDAADPFTSMARAYTKLFIVRSDEPKEQYIKDMLKFFKIDGIIYHDAKTCPNNSNCRYGMPKRLEEETKIPSLTLNGDLNDLRCVSDEQNKTNIEAFIEQLEESKPGL
ncbi:MAG: 2-hydroxyacyl-CoA dehydratase family protein [Syntrophales bacterium]|jgi:benzoyl-CoA reductase/2-hydroxyglutaryl-CoA dehydratase subunit BcrC/BadD/HgdB|nr:2-hydroxyacyl-CoA dehydratase family protein [Syntrophales bacterium]